MWEWGYKAQWVLTLVPGLLFYDFFVRLQLVRKSQEYQFLAVVVVMMLVATVESLPVHNGSTPRTVDTRRYPPPKKQNTLNRHFITCKFFARQAERWQSINIEALSGIIHHFWGKEAHAP